LSEKAAHSGSSFYYSFLFLPPESAGAAITALYALCRESTTRVTSPAMRSVARARP